MIEYINYILLDAARMGQQMDFAKKLNPKHDSLYRGGSEESLSGVAPYLFSFKSDSNFAAWFFEKGWGDSWGIMIKSLFPMNEIHKHFRKFLLVKTEDDEELYFRFYDPRVLRIFLPTCDSGQIRELFGSIDYFMMEDEDPEFAVRFWHENGNLKSVQIPKREFLIPKYVAEEFESDVLIEENIYLPIPNQVEIIAEKKVVTITNNELPPETKLKSKWNMFD